MAGGRRYRRGWPARLGEEAKRLIGEAEIVFGGKRHLALAADRIKGETRAWPSPFDAAMRDVVALRGKNVCVLASGDPFLHGVGVTLAKQVPAEEMLVIPSPSAFSLAASRLGWALQDTETVSLHGHAIDLIRPLLQPKRRVLALTSDGRRAERGGGVADRPRLRSIEADRAGGAGRRTSASGRQRPLAST